MTKYVIEMNKSDWCGDCVLNKKKELSCSLYDEWSGCPFKELKAKQLEWKEVDKGHRFMFYFKAITPLGSYYLYKRGECGKITIEFKKERLGANFKTIHDAKQACYDNYNERFLGMMEEK